MEMSKHGMTSNHASQVKRGGHLREQIFSNQFSDSTMQDIGMSVNYTGSTADCYISRFDYQYILEELNVNRGTTSVKGGSTYQFHLGRIPELLDPESVKLSTIHTSTGKPQTCVESNITQTQQLQALHTYLFWVKYLGKGEILAIDAHNYWHFFRMSDVLNLLINPNLISWRFLPTGRIKGDLHFKSGQSRTGITFEYRVEKSQSVLGAHGGKSGISVFLPWLFDHLTCIKVKKMLV
jgi:hypothetical protein